jgi:hypothetical protein
MHKRNTIAFYSKNYFKFYRGNFFIYSASGDLGLSTKISENRAVQAADLSRDITSAAMTCLGTPEFMAPELYEEKYDEKVFFSFDFDFFFYNNFL